MGGIHGHRDLSPQKPLPHDAGQYSIRAMAGTLVALDVRSVIDQQDRSPLSEYLA